jgi:hypothetical protein
MIIAEATIKPMTGFIARLKKLLKVLIEYLLKKNFVVKIAVTTQPDANCLGLKAAVP